MADGFRSEQTFEVNGKTYRSLDEVPQPYRDAVAALLADRDGDGVPDAFEGGTSQVIRHESQTFEVDGVAYSSIDEVPAHDRARVEAAFDRLSTEAAAARPAPAREISVGATGSTSPATPPPASIVTSAGWSSRTKLLLAFMALDAVAVGVILWIVLR